MSKTVPGSIKGRGIFFASQPSILSPVDLMLCKAIYTKNINDDREDNNLPHLAIKTDVSHFSWRGIVVYQYVPDWVGRPVKYGDYYRLIVS